MLKKKSGWCLRAGFKLGHNSHCQSQEDESHDATLPSYTTELPRGTQLLPWALQEYRVSFPILTLSHSLPLHFLSLVAEKTNLSKPALVSVSPFHICCCHWLLTSLIRNRGSPTLLRVSSVPIWQLTRGNHLNICLRAELSRSIEVWVKPQVQAWKDLRLYLAWPSPQSVNRFITCQTEKIFSLPYKGILK